jgi:hypothetical protein
MPYAERTEVPVSKSKAEIEGLIERYGGSKYQAGWDGERALIMFEAEGRRVRFVLPLPQRDNFTSQRGYEQEQRRVWRSLCLVIKAKLESWQAGIEGFEEAFLAQILLPSNSTVGDWLRPQIAEAYRSGAMPAMLALPEPKVLRLEGNR